jgi:hypothetical protein
MPSYTKPSVRELLDRWAESFITGVDIDWEVGSLTKVDMTVQTRRGLVKLVPVSVKAESGTDSLEVIDKAFTQFATAPLDAVILAAEVRRLRERVAELEGK